MIVADVKGYPEEERDDMLLLLIAEALMEAGYDIDPYHTVKEKWDKGNDWYIHF